MNMRDCKRLKPGALVHEAYAVSGCESVGIVLSKEYVEEEHYAMVLGGRKSKRYDLYVHWLKKPKYRKLKSNPAKHQCWEVKLVKNGE